MNILLDYFFKITSIVATPAASTAFLKQACVVVRPLNGGVTVGTIVTCTTSSQIDAVAAANGAADAKELLNAGMSKVYLLPMNDLDLAEALEGHETDFYTLLISSDFSDADVLTGEQVTTAEVKSSKKIQDIFYTSKLDGVAGDGISIEYIEDAASGNQALISVDDLAITVDIDAAATTAETIAAAIAGDEDADALVSAVVDDGDEEDVQTVTGDAINLTGGVDEVTDEGSGLDLGAYSGVVGLSSTDDAFLATQNAISKRCGFHTTTANKAKNLCFAFGKLLSNALSWRNQQFIEMPYGDDINTVGAADALFENKTSFVISDGGQYGNRLGLFAAGGKAIVAPYIIRNIEIDMQSKGLQYVSANQPGYTHTHAALLEDELRKILEGDGQEGGNQGYIGRGDIESGSLSILLEQDDFTASGYINVKSPRAFWRINGQLTQS